MKVDKSKLSKQAYIDYRATKATEEFFRSWILELLAFFTGQLQDWTVTLADGHRLLIIRYGHGDNERTAGNLAEFTKLTKWVETRTGKAMKKSLSDFLGNENLFMDANHTLESIPVFNQRGNKITEVHPKIEIRMFGVDNCDIEFQEVTVKKPIVSGFCAEAIK
jgi:hypothetical protein